MERTGLLVLNNSPFSYDSLFASRETQSERSCSFLIRETTMQSGTSYFPATSNGEVASIAMREVTPCPIRTCSEVLGTGFYISRSDK